MGKKKSKSILPCYADVPNMELEMYDGALEQAVCQAPFFRENDLRLYRNADLLDFHLQGVSGTCRVPYLLCQGSRALLVFQTFEKTRGHDRKQICPGGLMELHFQKGTEEKALDILQRAVEKVLPQETGPKSKHPRSVRRVAARYWSDLVREGLVERSRLPDGRLCWGLSLLGEKQGLYWGWWFQEGKLWGWPLWSSQVQTRLTLQWETHTGKQRSLDQRLQNADGGYSRDLMERFAQMELGTYLNGYPAHLALLEEEFGVGPDTPFHQAAALIWERMESNNRQTCERGIKLMRLLAVPLINK